MEKQREREMKKAREDMYEEKNKVSVWKDPRQTAFSGGQDVLGEEEETGGGKTEADESTKEEKAAKARESDHKHGREPG